MRNLQIALMILIFMIVVVPPTHADIFDKMNGFLDNVNKKLDDVDKALEKGIEQANRIGGQVSTTVGRTPGIVAEDSSSSRRIGSSSVDDTKYNYDSAPAGDPETKYSKKTLEALAAFGDKWARLKLEEMNSREVMDAKQKEYKDTSWWNVFNKVGNYFDYKNTKKQYEESRERTEEYKRLHPESGKIIEGMDTINETFLEFKALFGDKKAKAKLELLKTERELQRLERVYEEAGMIDKFKMRKELAYARERYEKAVQQYAIAEGKVTTSASSRIPTTPGTVATETAESGNVIDRLKDLGNDLKDRVIGNDDGTVATSPTIVNNGENATVTALKAQVDAAFRRYMNALNTPNVDKTNLRNLKKEYQKLNKQLFETMN